MGGDDAEGLTPIPEPRGTGSVARHNSGAEGFFEVAADRFGVVAGQEQPQERFGESRWELHRG
jgi:hypothetical protein